jgi:hypothetical protein
VEAMVSLMCVPHGVGVGLEWSDFVDAHRRVDDEDCQRCRLFGLLVDGRRYGAAHCSNPAALCWQVVGRNVRGEYFLLYKLTRSAGRL